MKIEAIGSSETLVPNYTACHPNGNKLHGHRHENFKFHTLNKMAEFWK
jgi:hypothetical protein